MASSIVIVGSCMIDFVCYSSRLPREGETLHGYKFVTNFGGKGANQCVAAHKLGASTTMIARVGDDLWGDKYINNFKDLGINHMYVKKTTGVSTGIAQISVADSGANQIIIVAGANSQLSVADILDSKSVIEKADVLVCQLETSSDVAIEAMKLCKGQIILNGAPALVKYDPELLTLPSIFCVNELEASELLRHAEIKSSIDNITICKLMKQPAIMTIEMTNLDEPIIGEDCTKDTKERVREMVLAFEPKKTNECNDENNYN
ncbi:pfkB family carbohydrate kinase [Popillia japonica]|uniref:PfkB family carbohydrate kinase n=1 Tax=Popillia japonica TaxID=7064 RepID=A0AAW1HWC4_POPJA